MHLLPNMLEAARKLETMFEDLQFVLPVAPTLEMDFVRQHVDRSGVAVDIVDGGVYDALRASDAAIVTSGTATLETGLMGVPMAIVYRVSGLSYFIGRLIVDVDHVGLVNIVAGKRLVPELIQQDATPQNMADAVSKMLNDPAYYKSITDGLAAVRARLGDAGASARAAAVVLELLKNAA
jgi:lipid-A-disaccharide synthase